MVGTNNTINILPTVFNMTSYNLVCVITMIVWISFLSLVIMVTILVGKYGLRSYQHASIYKMEKCHLLAIATVIICMSTERPGHQHSETAVIILQFGLWTEL